jgi:hypothetical protein
MMKERIYVFVEAIIVSLLKTESLSAAFQLSLLFTCIELLYLGVWCMSVVDKVMIQLCIVQLNASKLLLRTIHQSLSLLSDFSTTDQVISSCTCFMFAFDVL